MTTPQCPKCATELNEEFGMVTCSGCGAVVFIDFEGQAQLAAEEMASSAESASGSVTAAELDTESFFAPASPESRDESSADFAEPASQIETPNDPIGLSAYADSEASQATGGPLTYTLHIEGLDSKELRESLREALGESRFGWDSAALMASIREGQLHLNDIAPVKASVLVNRLKRLPLTIWWEQNVVTDSSP